ncbi:hypothetical protein C8J57DRAFT_1252306 [Mycena rebaudengoi]|nr:hypothetical protein C8J57DRAFT_1252306 [Mycena rebaudengoi]
MNWISALGSLDYTGYFLESDAYRAQAKLAGCPTLTTFKVCDSDQDSQPPASYLDIDWLHISDRAARSGGKVEMHLMCISDCGEARCRLFPMRFATGDQYAALKTLASGDKGISRDEEMAALVTATENMVSFHC